MHKTASVNVVATKVNDCLIVTVGDDLSEGCLEEVKRTILSDIHKEGCLSIIFELSALKFMDTIEFEGLKSISEMAIFLGARSLFVGIQPELCRTLLLTMLISKGSMLAWT